MSTTTPNLDIEHIAASQNQKEVTANTAFDDFDTVQTDQSVIDVSGNSDVTPPTDDVLLWYNIKLVGTLTGNINLILPNNKRQYRIQHAATDASIGNYTVTVKTASGSGVVVRQGESRQLWCNGTDILNNDTKAGAAPTIVTAPLTASSAGEPGQVAYDATHFYVCIAQNTWVRATLATF